MTTGGTESATHHFAAQAKKTSISEEFQCFDFDRLSASCLRGLVLSASVEEDFPTCGSSSTPRGIFKRSARRFFQLQPFHVEIYCLVVSPKSPTEILKLTPQRRHASELAAFAHFFGVREKFFHLAFIRLNLVTALNRFREQCSLEDLEF